MASLSVERSILAKYKITHLITVEGVRSRFARRKEMTSSKFSCPDDPRQVKFKILLKFGVDLSCFLQPQEEVYATDIIFSVMNADWKLLQSLKAGKVAIGGAEKADWGWGQLWKHADQPSGDTLYVKCEISYDGASKSVDNATIVPRDPSLHDDLLKLLTQPKQAEIVTLIVGDQKFEAHKDILLTRSSYFQTLFDSGMREAQTNVIPIEEAEPKHFRELLAFIYSGLPPTNLPTIAHSLLPLADRYAIMALRNTCITAIISTLSLKNVIGVMLLADTHSCPELTKKCLPLIKENIKTLKTTEDWKELKKNPEILATVLESFGE